MVAGVEGDASSAGADSASEMEIGATMRALASMSALMDSKFSPIQHEKEQSPSAKYSSLPRFDASARNLRNAIVVGYFTNHVAFDERPAEDCLPAGRKVSASRWPVYAQIFGLSISRSRRGAEGPKTQNSPISSCFGAIATSNSRCARFGPTGKEIAMRGVRQAIGRSKHM